jgi:hypothetical protein
MLPIINENKNKTHKYLMDPLSPVNTKGCFYPTGTERAKEGRTPPLQLSSYSANSTNLWPQQRFRCGSQGERLVLIKEFV